MKDAKLLVISWSNDFAEVQQLSKVICSNISSGEKVQMQWKKELWPGVIESVWGKLSHLLPKAGNDPISDYKKFLHKNIHNSIKSIITKKKKKFLRTYLSIFLSISFVIDFGMSVKHVVMALFHPKNCSRK